MRLFILLAASLSTTATALDFLRGDTELHLQQFACTLSGASDQDSCDATKDEQGAKCVWCSISTFGLCVSEDVAEKIKTQIPGIVCDDDSPPDDDTAPTTDDKTPDVPGDDTVPSDYWKCLESYGDSDSCTGAGCVWCDTKGGFGVCMDKDAADDASKGDWFTCKVPQALGDPFDTSCIAATKEGSESACAQTVDAEGFHCNWCAIGNSGGLCLNDDQISIAEQLGESCEGSVMDPYDPSCIAVTVGGDESSCEQTMDADGSACLWCSIGTNNLCLNGDQAHIAEQVGGSCGEGFTFEAVNDLYDPSCIAVTMGGDESSCKQTMDADGAPCEWCSVGTTNLCLNGDQGQIAEQFGGSCEKSVEDPYDPSCVAVTIGGDESTCKQTVDADGSACEWCSIGTTSLCLNGDQAQIAEQIGGSCNAGKMDSGILSSFFS